MGVPPEGVWDPTNTPPGASLMGALNRNAQITNWDTASIVHPTSMSAQFIFVVV
jgi:hypothetical protein